MQYDWGRPSKWLTAHGLQMNLRRVAILNEPKGTRVNTTLAYAFPYTELVTQTAPTCRVEDAVEPCPRDYGSLVTHTTIAPHHPPRHPLPASLATLFRSHRLKTQGRKGQKKQRHTMTNERRGAPNQQWGGSGQDARVRLDFALLGKSGAYTREDVLNVVI